jgi:hypothetical protein
MNYLLVNINLNLEVNIIVEDDWEIISTTSILDLVESEVYEAIQIISDHFK